MAVLCVHGRAREESVLVPTGARALQEMTHYLTSVYNIVYATVPGTEERIGVTAAELARVTAQAAFEDADENGDGRLS